MSTGDHDSKRERPIATPALAGRMWVWIQRLGTTFHILIVSAALASAGYASLSFVRAAASREPAKLPDTMEDVNWQQSQSSAYCLACHKPIGPAMAGLDFEHGHPQNVALNEAQLQALDDMGTAPGPGGTLICMSCHVLNADSDTPYMLADTLAGGRLCERCHPGHYARNTPHDLRTSAPSETNRLGQTADVGGPCSACHLAHRYARDFVPCDHDPDGRCTTCHQTHHCAAQHARSSMEHPESRCLECHDPHDMSHGEFLKQPVAELCITCHEGFDAGAAAGMHPLGAMDFPVPQELIEAGAWTLGSSHELTCTVCHDTHAAGHEKLLVLKPDSNRLCLACHDDKAGELAAEGMAPRHAQSPLLSPAQRAVVDAWRTRVGPQGELLCISCHRVHGSKSPMALLAFQPKYGETCGACHPEHDSVCGTSHDLRTNFPDERNAVGMTPAKHGACSACHLAHGFAREAVSTVGDPAGQCMTCHQPGSCGAGHVVEGANHPKTACTECHNPHERRYGNYLAQPPRELCATCHEDQSRLLGGPHDCSLNPDQWPDAGQATGGPCVSCHVPHGGARADLFRIRGSTPVGNHDDVCLVCHADAAWGGASGNAAIHPHEISRDEQRVELALVPKDDAGNMRMGCRTCHDPHGGLEPVHLARVASGQRTDGLCLHCHAKKEYIQYTGHSAESLMRFGFDVDSCKPCHAMHADSEGTWGQMLSPRFLMDRCGGLGDDVAACVPCLACHHSDGPAPVRAIATHPEKEMFNAISPDAPAYLPLFNAAGQIDPAGRVMCRTCHLSHGRLDLLRRVAERESLSPAEQSAIRTQVRQFIAPNVCTECHGPDEARLRFLFFHNPERRVFPHQDPASQSRP